MPELLLESPLLVALTTAFVTEEVSAQSELILHATHHLLLQLTLRVIRGHLPKAVVIAFKLEYFSEHGTPTALTSLHHLTFPFNWICLLYWNVFHRVLFQI